MLDAVRELNPSEYAWPSLLHNDLDSTVYRVINLSKPGNSLSGMFLDFIHFDKHHSHTDPIDLIIFSVTSFDRMLIAHSVDPNLTTNWVMSDDDTLSNVSSYDDAKLCFAKYLSNDTLISLNAMVYIHAFFNYAKLKDIKCLWSAPDKPNLYGQDNWVDFANELFFTHLFNYDFSGKYNDAFNKTCIVEDGHPNNLGHQLYYEQIVKPNIIKYIKENL
jgi:hypothetical protein